ncbi:DNA polymerase III subunit delta [Flammeovirgaceae bacterium SG7u.111]|nr:DNA polymerase III subunit delta [Flammeovirgaceae bacterium SG7u.132]WPO35893.1 DNA polymerase III subunit delta [Flammeovirgaceae bacterium SG7u.111]
MQFSDINGLEEVKKTLIQSVSKGHVAHAQLFMSSPGNANLPLALAFATYVSCTDQQENDSCGKCPSCVKMKKFIHPDLHFIFPTATTKKITKNKDAISQAFLPDWREFLTESPYRTLPEWAFYFGAENKQCTISKEESLNIIRSLSLKAFEGEFKIMMVWLPELMHPSAANAILKILEEPPPKTLFFLVTNHSEQLLTTILSRTQAVKVRDFHDAELKSILTEKYSIPEEKAGHISYLAEGNMNTALRLITDHQDNSTEYFKEWMRICFRNDYTSMVDFAEEFQKMGKEAQKSLFQYALGITRESMAWQFAEEKLVRLEDKELEFVKNFSKVLTPQRFEYMTKYFNESIRFVERNANPKILFMNLSLQMGKLFKI